MGVWVITSVTSSKDKGEAEAIEEPSLFETNNQFIPIFLPLNIVIFFYFIFDSLLMDTAYKQFKLP